MSRESEAEDPASRSRLFVMGGAHIDRRGRVAGRFVPGASNPGSMREEPGGGALNAARAAVQRGVHVSLMSLRGGDSTGEAVAAAIAASGIKDRSVTFLDRQTPSYTAILDDRGGLVAGLADMALYDLFFARQASRRATRDAVQAADSILLDANLPEEAIARLVSHAGDRPVYGIAVSPAKVLRFAGVLPRIACLFLNGAEAAALGAAGSDAGALARLAQLGLKRAVMTRGAAGILCLDAGEMFSLAAPETSDIVDVTGAGDALAGATIAALLRRLPFEAAVREGMAAAHLAIRDAAASPVLEPHTFAEVVGQLGPASRFDKLSETPT